MWLKHDVLLAHSLVRIRELISNMNLIKSFSERRENIYTSILILLLLVGRLPKIFLDNTAIVLALNGSHKPWLDLAARTITHLGSLWSYIIFLSLVVFFAKSMRQAIFAGFSFFYTCVVVEVMKNFFCKNSPRPIDAIPLERLHLIEGFAYDHFKSFPSGHASTVFVMTIVLSFLFMDKKTFFHIAVLSLAIAVAMSRVYLAMHFYKDVYAGAAIAIACTMATDLALRVVRLPSWLEGDFRGVVKIFFHKQ